MSPKRYYTFMIEQELINALKVGKELCLRVSDPASLEGVVCGARYQLAESDS
jgi:hypothetical protein